MVEKVRTFGSKYKAMKIGAIADALEEKGMYFINADNQQPANIERDIRRKNQEQVKKYKILGGSKDMEIIFHFESNSLDMSRNPPVISWKITATDLRGIQRQINDLRKKKRMIPHEEGLAIRKELHNLKIRKKDFIKEAKQIAIFMEKSTSGISILPWCVV